MVELFVSNRIFNPSSAYIYIWFSFKDQIIYVGMTNQHVGTLGRAAQHLDKRGTLRKRFLEKKGYSVNLSEDLILFSFILPSDKKYTTVERSYREAIEYLVQKRLIELRGILPISYHVISWVKTNERVSNTEVIHIADSIINKFISALNKLNNNVIGKLSSSTIYNETINNFI